VIDRLLPRPHHQRTAASGGKVILVQDYDEPHEFTIMMCTDESFITNTAICHNKYKNYPFFLSC